MLCGVGIGFGSQHHRHPLSFHIGQVRRQLRWYPPSTNHTIPYHWYPPPTNLYPVHLYTSSPIVAMESLGGTLAHLKHPRTPPKHLKNTFQIFLIILPVVDPSPKSLLRLQEISYLGKIHYFILILSPSVLI